MGKLRVSEYQEFGEDQTRRRIGRDVLASGDVVGGLQSASCNANPNLTSVGR